MMKRAIELQRYGVFRAYAVYSYGSNMVSILVTPEQFVNPERQWPWAVGVITALRVTR
mgnify:CR=1 FL=1